MLRTSFGERRFSQYFNFFAPSDSFLSNSCISAKYCPIITNHTSMEINGCIHLSFRNVTFMTGFVVQGPGQGVCFTPDVALRSSDRTLVQDSTAAWSAAETSHPDYLHFYCSQTPTTGSCRSEDTSPSRTLQTHTHTFYTAILVLLIW